jgi:hypothetical protein
MHFLKRFGLTAFTLVGLALTAAVAPAAEPRPWLCRDKPVFSSDRAMTYEASNRGGGHWVITFMRFDPAGGHDGFTVVSSREIAGRVDGTLEAGQWYAVALYREGSHWICPEVEDESGSSSNGSVSDLCYSEQEGGCAVKLLVRAAGASEGSGGSP